MNPFISQYILACTEAELQTSGHTVRPIHILVSKKYGSLLWQNMFQSQLVSLDRLWHGTEPVGGKSNP